MFCVVFNPPNQPDFTGIVLMSQDLIPSIQDRSRHARAMKDSQSGWQVIFEQNLIRSPYQTKTTITVFTMTCTVSESQSLIQGYNMQHFYMISDYEMLPAVTCKISCSYCTHVFSHKGCRLPSKNLAYSKSNVLNMSQKGNAQLRLKLMGIRFCCICICGFI